MRCLVKELGADVNQAMDNGSTALIAAVKLDNLDLMRLLVIELGAHVNYFPLFSALIVAADDGYVEMMRYLVKELGSNVNAPVPLP
jgi:ankyrin repeat protein